ncbi:MAG: hypothetical protein JO180_08175 [Gemmatirosa sp.]|nr:hypothetical protein [Gemmatirosa sp.]
METAESAASRAPRFTLRLLGGATLLGPDGSPVGGRAAHRHRLALLAILAMTRCDVVMRDKLLGLLWPERDEPAARHLLSVALHELRGVLGASAIAVVGRGLRLNPRRVAVDVHAFEDAVASGDLAAAVAAYGGPFLDGFFLDDAHDFEEWVDEHRARLGRLRERAATPAVARSGPPGPPPPLAESAHSTPDEAIREPRVDPPFVPAQEPASPPAPIEVGPPRRGQRWRRWSIAAGIAGAVGLGAAGWSAVRARPVAPRADVLAVAPFVVVGDLPADLRDGLADLLAANLDQVGDVQAVSARASAAAVRRLTTDGAPPSAARLARELGADAVVTAVVASTPGGIRVDASLVGPDGRVLARGDVRGTLTDLSGMVDRATVVLLRELWGPRWRVPAPRLAAVTTASAVAMRAYMRGESFLRAAQWDSAAVAFTDAADVDSTFALAQFRLAETDGWRQGLGSAATVRALGAALRHADRLPPRERGLLAVWTLHEAGDVTAIDSAVRLAERYPVDPDVRFARADTRFHALRLFGARDAEETAAGFDSAAAIDLRSARVAAHAIELALARGDRDRFDRFAELAAVDATPDRQARLRLLRVARWGDPSDAVTAIERYLHGDALNARDVGDVLIAFSDACLDGASPPRPDLLLRVLLAARAAAGASPANAALRRTVDARTAGVLAALGRTNELVAHLDRMEMESESPLDALVVAAAIGGTTPLPASWLLARSRAFAADSLSGDFGRLRAGYWRALMLLAAGDWRGGRAALPAGLATVDAASRAFAGATRAARGWSLVIERDSTRGVAEMRAGLLDAGYGDVAMELTAPLRARLAILEAARADSRALGIDRLRRMRWSVDQPLPLIARRALVAALEASGDRGDATAERARLAAIERTR